MINTVFLVQRIGPYHHARFKAWAGLRRHIITVIEFRAVEKVYSWTPVTEEGGYQRRQTSSRSEMLAALVAIRPQVIVCTGYADLEISWAVAWALRRHIPLVTCSDSTEADERRSWIKERFKRVVVGSFDTALVAGSRSQSYLASLGLESKRQFRPWDVVDNAYFASGADLSRGIQLPLRAKLNLPAQYFLCVARFVPKKNLTRLIEAYRRYVSETGQEAWSLVLSGNGPEESALRALVDNAGLGTRVHFSGFMQYPDLPALYGLAGALVLPSLSDQWGLVVNEAMAAGIPVLVSKRCGCVPDLVREGMNGFTFDPEDADAISSLLAKIAAASATERLLLGDRSREIVGAFSPPTFAEGLTSAISAALGRVRRKAGWTTRLAVGLLEQRQFTGS